MSTHDKEPLQADTNWFHVFKTMIDAGDAARMGPYAFMVYCVIKAHTNFSTGRAFPAIETISQKSGISPSKVKEMLKTLEEHGYITKEKRGRNNLYTLREKIEIHDGSGRPAAVATWDYLPAGVSEAVADLKNVLVTGDLAGAKVVHIDNLHFQIVTGGIGIQQNASVPLITPEELESLKSLHPTLARKISDRIKKKE